VTLYLDWKSSSFCLSRISGALRNAAWPRLGEHRSWQGKARKQRIHPCKLFPGRCHARCWFHADAAKGRMAHNLRSASWEPATPTSFDASPGECTHQGGGFSMPLFLSAAALPKAVEWIPVPSQQHIAWYIWKNTVVFLPRALRYRTRTLFSFQGALYLFSHRR
jgi:hypothetical protein